MFQNNSNVNKTKNLKNRDFFEKNILDSNKMRANELISIPFNEKVYGIEVFHDDATDLVAVGLKNSIVIYQLTVNENDPTKEKLQSQVIQAVSSCTFVTLIPTFFYVMNNVPIADQSRFHRSLNGMVAINETLGCTKILQVSHKWFRS